MITHDSGRANRGHDLETPVECVAAFDPDAYDYALRRIEKILGTTLVKVTARAAG